MRLLANASANYVGAAAVVGLPILVLPFFVHALGESTWGIVGLIVSIQSLLGALDTGFSQVLIREFALRSGARGGSSQSGADLLYSCERVYWFVALTIGVAGVVAALLVTMFVSAAPGHRWPVAAIAALCGGLLCAAQLPGFLYRSAVMGAQAQVRLNAIVITAALVRSVGGAVLVTLIPTVATYVIVSVVVLLLETLARRQLAWRVVGAIDSRKPWSAREFRAVLRDMSILAVAVICGGFAAQADKLVVSAMLPVSTLAHYFIASQVALGALQLIYPLTSAALPQVVQLSGSPRAQFRLNLRLFGIIAALVVAGAVAYLLVGQAVLRLWLRHDDLATRVYGLLAFMLVGVAGNALCNVGYMRWLATNRVLGILGMNVAALAVMLLLAPLMVDRWGEQGAAQAWIITGTLNLVLTCGWLKGARGTD